MSRRALLAVALLLSTVAGLSHAQEPALHLPVTVKSTVAATRARGALTAPGRFDAVSAWRLRLEPALSTEPVSVQLAYELSLQLEANPAAGTQTPFRVEDLDAVLAQGHGATLKQELDRASLTVRLPPLTITAGRQAVGWGRGTFFRPADLLLPFAPLEFDRDWRRGVDAIRAELRLDETSSGELMVVGARRAEELAFLGRLRGYAGQVDYELIGGKRVDAWLVGATCSAALFGAELHAEGVLHLVDPPWPLGGGWSGGRTVGVFALGGSYTLDLGTGLTLLAEVGRSGFGAEDPQALLRVLGDPRVVRWQQLGDAQFPGRWAAALVASYAPGLTTAASAAVLVDPQGPSALAAITVSWDVSEAIRLMGTGYLPFGAPPSTRDAGSFYGSAPASLLVQVRLDADPLAR